MTSSKPLTFLAVAVGARNKGQGHIYEYSTSKQVGFTIKRVTHSVAIVGNVRGLADDFLLGPVMGSQ